jgi:hypothetical protein
VWPRMIPAHAHRCAGRMAMYRKRSAKFAE